MILLLRIKEVNICQFFRRFFSLKKLLNKGKDKPINLMIDIFLVFLSFVCKRESLSNKV